MRGWTVKQKLIGSGVASYVAGGLVIFYWTDAPYIAVGVVFAVGYFVSIVTTYLWFQRTD